MIYDVLGAISQSYEENILSSQGGLAEGLYQEEDPKGHQHISQTLAYLHKPLCGLQNIQAVQIKLTRQYC